MANTRISAFRHAQPRRSSRSVAWMSERQLDAYLQARETLRRLRATAALAPDPRRDTSPGSAA